MRARRRWLSSLSRVRRCPIVREAIDEGIYSRFVFGDAAKRVSLVREIGGHKLGGMFGTAGASAPGNAAAAAWEASFMTEYGELPVLAYVKETYDATVALALAAQAAGSVERSSNPRPAARNLRTSWAGRYCHCRRCSRRLVLAS